MAAILNKEIRKTHKQGYSVMAIFVLVLSSLLLFGGCSGGGSNDTATGGGGTAAGTGIAGTWNMTDTKVTDTCGEPLGGASNYQMTVTQKGNKLTMLTSDMPNTTFSGTISGNTATFSGSFSDTVGGRVGTVTGTMTVSYSGNSLSGGIDWTFDDGTTTCRGTNSVSGTRA